MTASPDFLAHNEGDSVAVAVRDLEAGPVQGGYLHGRSSVALQLVEPVPLGHKLAMVDVPVGDEVIEYGLRVGLASADISAGHHVHVHNVRSARWQTSTASTAGTASTA